MVPTPAIPEPLAIVLWTLALVVAFTASLWAGFRWLVGRIDERFQAAIRSESFAVVVDKRVAAAFDGAVGPLMAAQRELSGQVAVAQASADAAHRRMDEHLENHRGAA